MDSSIRVPDTSDDAAKLLIDNDVLGKFVLVSWNINGIDQSGNHEDFVLRMIAICEAVVEAGASVVFLQEVVQPAMSILTRLLAPLYQILTPGSAPSPYFCIMLLRKGKVEPLGSLEVENFVGSKMGRHLLKQRVRIDAQVAGTAHDVQLMTAHLESTLGRAAMRKKQLSTALDQMVLAAAGGITAVFGGDLNIRDAELKTVRMPCHVSDVWECCGSCETERWTWDGTVNDTCSGAGTGEKQFRFDRMLHCSGLQDECHVDLKSRARAYKQIGKSKLKQTWHPISFRLLGRTRIAECGIFPSDHWGICAVWQLSPGACTLKSNLIDSAATRLLEKCGNKTMVPANSSGRGQKRGRQTPPINTSKASSTSSSSRSSSSSSSSSAASSGSDRNQHVAPHLDAKEEKPSNMIEDNSTATDRNHEGPADLSTQEHHIPLATAGNKEYEARTTCELLIRKALNSAGASPTEAAAWASSIESSAWAHVQDVSGTAGERYHFKDLPVALRLYRAEVRRLSSAVKDKMVSSDLFDRLRRGILHATKIVALPAEDLLPQAKRCRLQTLRASASNGVCERDDLPYKSDDITCQECGKLGNVRFGYLPGVREGYGNPESWGSNENDNRGERCRAQCLTCLAEWIFEQ